ncbi:protein phosphatase regulator BUD14 [Sugiyamaella lignohabitans]|uniref:Protein phosphatase regulator BUD14 n=1 Tax=Sugiyamaella lignohabitans TaxID=796027 RepID=A0A167FXN5_9ASCO|nr:protein phosphatase regulator BUD14 [Sugiyamaella lignohabitans]ANB15834.1 protein phosphatase regulator BUD14 [Sugiyamaella lignohabitans]
MSSEIMDDDDFDQLSSSPSIHEEEIDFQYVYALRTFVATEQGQANAFKGDSMILLNDTNSYWWLVRIVKDSTVGFLPAEHIETPWERLARLNKHRNGELCMVNPMDLAASAKGNNLTRMFSKGKKTDMPHGRQVNTGEHSVNKLSSKSVSFHSQSVYVSASEYEYSADEAEDDDHEEAADDEVADDEDEGDEGTQSKVAAIENHAQFGIDSENHEQPDRNALKVLHNGIIIDNVDRTPKDHIKVSDRLDHGASPTHQDIDTDATDDGVVIAKFGDNQLHQHRYLQPELQQTVPSLSTEQEQGRHHLPQGNAAQQQQQQQTREQPPLARSSLEKDQSGSSLDSRPVRSSIEYQQNRPSVDRPSFDQHNGRKPLLIQKTRGRAGSYSSNNSSASSTTSSGTGLRSFMNKFRAVSNNSIVGEDLGAAILSYNDASGTRQLADIDERAKSGLSNHDSLDSVSVSSASNSPSDKTTKRRSLITAKSSIEQLSLRKKATSSPQKQGTTDPVQQQSSTFGRLFKRKSKQNLMDKESQKANKQALEEQKQKLDSIQQQLEKKHDKQQNPQQPPVQFVHKPELVVGDKRSTRSLGTLEQPKFQDQSYYDPRLEDVPPVVRPSGLADTMTPGSSDSSSTRLMLASAASYSSSITSRDSLEEAPSAAKSMHSPIPEHPELNTGPSNQLYTAPGVRTSFLQHRPIQPGVPVSNGNSPYHVQPPFTRPQMRNVSAASAISVSSIQSESHFQVKSLPQSQSHSQTPSHVQFQSRPQSTPAINRNPAVSTQRQDHRSSQMLASAEVEAIFRQQPPAVQHDDLKSNSPDNPYIISDSEDDQKDPESVPIANTSHELNSMNATSGPHDIIVDNDNDDYDSDVVVVDSREHTTRATPSPTPSQRPPPSLTARDEDEESPGSDRIETPTLGYQEPTRINTHEPYSTTTPLAFKPKSSLQPIPLRPPSPPSYQSSEPHVPSTPPLRMKLSDNQGLATQNLTTTQLPLTLHPDIMPIYQETNDRLGRLSSVSTFRHLSYCSYWTILTCYKKLDALLQDYS